MKEKTGFTLIELIIVIVLISILSIIILPKIFTTGYKAKPEVTKLITQIRYIQHESMLRGGGYGLGIDSPNKRYFFFYGTPSSRIILPGEDSPYITVSDGIAAKNSLGNSITRIFFDDLGRPDIDNNSLNNDEMNFSDDNPYRYTITVNIDGLKVIIAPYSGGVYEQ